MNLTPQRLRRLRRLAVVPRWVVVPTIQKQSVAEHSFHVAHIALWVARKRTWPENTYATVADLKRLDADIMYYALIHDETEAITGDIPSPAGKVHIPGKTAAFEKNNYLGCSTASPELKQILKIADLLEAWLFVIEDQALGNKGLNSISQDIDNRIISAFEGFPYLSVGNFGPVYAARALITEFVQTYAPHLHPVNEDPEIELRENNTNHV